MGGRPTPLAPSARGMEMCGPAINKLFCVLNQIYFAQTVLIH
uniref:Uncharacterized protein n=1 Tax=Anguilla anguilla TaxID=7936 RepID=A0A0E9VHW9_ANGAN